jgi:hypothetical protein
MEMWLQHPVISMNEMLALIEPKCSFLGAPLEYSRISSVVANKAEAVFAEVEVINEAMVINVVEDKSTMDKIEAEAGTEVKAMTTTEIKNTVDDHNPGTVFQIVHAQDQLRPLVPHATVDPMSMETSNVASRQWSVTAAIKLVTSVQTAHVSNMQLKGHPLSLMQ